MAHRRFIWAVGSSLLVLLLCGTAVAADPKAYITLPWLNQIAVINTVSGDVKTIEDVRLAAPSGVAVTPSRAYITNNGSDTVAVIDTSTDAVIDTILVGWRPFGIAVDATRNRLYVANQGDNSVTVIDTTDDSNSLVTTVAVSQMPVGVAVAVNPAGTKVFVTSRFSATLDVIDATEPISPESVTPVGIPGLREGVAASPDGGRVFVAVDNGSASLLIFDPQTHTWTPVALTLRHPLGVAVDPKGERVYIGHARDSFVSIVAADVATPSEIEGIAGSGFGVWGLTVNPNVPDQLWAAAEDSLWVRVLDTSPLGAHSEPLEFEEAPLAFGTFIAAVLPDEGSGSTDPDPGCDDGLRAAVEASLGKVETAMRNAFEAGFSVPGATPAAQLTRVAEGVKNLNRGHLIGIYQNLLGPQPAWEADPEFCDDDLKQAVQQVLSTLETTLRGIDRSFELHGGGLVSRLQNVAHAIERLDRGRLQGLYSNIR